MRVPNNLADSDIVEKYVGQGMLARFAAREHGRRIRLMIDINQQHPLAKPCGEIRRKVQCASRFAAPPFFIEPRNSASHRSDVWMSKAFGRLGCLERRDV